MIYKDIAMCVESAIGTSLDMTQQTRLYYALSTNLGKERHYFPGLPKLEGQMRVNMLGTATDTMTQSEISRAIGIPARTIRRLKNGR